MTVAFGSSSSTAFGPRTNTTVTAPASIADGDVLIGLITTVHLSASPFPDVTPPAGWTQISVTHAYSASGVYLKAYAFIKVASSESGSYTFTHINADYGSQAVIMRYTGSNGVINAVSQNAGTPANTTRTATGITTTVNDCMLLYLGWDFSDTGTETPPTGMTERFDASPLYAADVIFTTAGATGNKTNTCNSASGDPRGAWLVALEPAGSSGAIIGSTTLSFTPSGAVVGSGALVGSNTLNFTHTSLLKGNGTLVGSNNFTFSSSSTGIAYFYGVGSSTLSFTSTGVLTGAGVLLGSTALSFAPSGAIVGVGTLIGSSTLSFSLTGTFVVTSGLIGSSTLSFTPSGVLTGSGGITGSSSLIFSPTGLLIGDGAIVGSNNLVFTHTPVLTGVGDVIGSSTLTFTPSASFSIGANSTLTFESTGTLTGTGLITGSGTLTFDLSGSVENIIPISGSATLTFVSIGRGFLIVNPYETSSGSSPGAIYTENSGSGPFLYYETSGTSPNPPYEEN